MEISSVYKRVFFCVRRILLRDLFAIVSGKGKFIIGIDEDGVYVIQLVNQFHSGFGA